MKVFKNGLLTELLLQLAIGPVFFFVINLTLQRTVWDGLFGGISSFLSINLQVYFCSYLNINY